MTHTETSVTVQRTVNAPVDQVFAVLTDPHKHTAMDGSGMLRGLDQGDRIEKAGVQFRMNMYADAMGGDYQTDNVVSAFETNKMVGWKTAPAGQEPPGWEWLWELDSTGADTTDVSLTYDWSHVDAETLEQVSFPMVTEQQLEESLAGLDSQVGKG